jgi:hypothetical protein
MTAPGVLTNLELVFRGSPGEHNFILAEDCNGRGFVKKIVKMDMIKEGNGL